MSVSPCRHCGLPTPADRHDFCCFGCRMAHGLLDDPSDADATHPARPAARLNLRLAVGVFLTMNLMVFSYFFYSRHVYDVTEEAGYSTLASLLAYLQMFLATGVVALLGLPLLIDCFDRRPWKPDANLLILIGVAAAFVLSVLHTLQGDPGLYFDTACVILVLVTLGGHLDSSAKRRATLLTAQLDRALPEQAFVAAGDDVQAVPAGAVTVGQRVRVRSGEKLPVDGVVRAGSAHVEESMLTGESQPRAVAPGDDVFAGSASLDGLLWIEATRVGADCTVATLERLLGEARLEQPPLQRVADRIAAAFIPGVLLLALGTFAYHAMHGSASDALFIALSVLLISCPCALGLAAPLATWCAMSKAAQQGVLFRSSLVLERAARLTQICFDKTGTLTTSRMELRALTCRSPLTEAELLQRAAAAESASPHPIGRSVVHAATARGLAWEQPTESTLLPGVGVASIVQQQRIEAGGARLHPQVDRDLPQPAGDLIVDVFVDGVLVGRLGLQEQLRPDAAQTMTELRALGVQCQVLTGDRPEAAARMSERLDIPAEGGLLPQDKLERLRGKAGCAMVGDGINDAAALAAADVGFAVDSAIDLAQQSGHVLLLSDKLDRIPLTIRLARRTRRHILINLAWAFGYNGIGLALAVCGYLNPIFAASAMVVSSLLIISTSRRV